MTCAPVLHAANKTEENIKSLISGFQKFNTQWSFSVA